MAKPFSTRHIPGFGLIAGVCFAALYLPIFVLVAYSFNASSSVSQWSGFSFHWFIEASQNAEVLDAALRSIQVASIASLVSTIVATTAALALTRGRSFSGMGILYAIINQPLAVPEVVTGVSLLIFFGAIKVYTGYSGLGYLLVAHSAFCVPFAFLPIRARLQVIDASLEMAAADLYATAWQTLRRVTLPMLRPAILAGAMLAFVISLDDVVITEFIKSSGQDTLPTYMLGQIRRGTSPQFNAISTGFLLLSVAIVTMSLLLNKNANKRKGTK